MMLFTRRTFNWRRYAHAMGHKHQSRNGPEPRLADIDRWVGMWIAVKDSEVIAAAYNSRDLVPKVRALGPRGDGAVAQFVPQRTDDIVIGVG